jgi:hypothetical protein
MFSQKKGATGIPLTDEAGRVPYGRFAIVERVRTTTSWRVHARQDIIPTLPPGSTKVVVDCLTGIAQGQPPVHFLPTVIDGVFVTDSERHDQMPGVTKV